MGGQSSYTCVGCGHANRETARFCENCGAGLAQSCGACGSELRPGARFCDACGAQMPAGAGPSSEAALKVVSVVFCDLAGSTALQEMLDAESVRRVMARFYEVMRGVVERFGGSVAKFIGDAIVASFGAPVSHEDDALRAVRSAAAMVAELDVLNDELERSWGVRLAMRTGVNTGELVVDDQGILVGDTMNTAARLEQAARAGEVLVGEATRRIVRGHVALEELEPLGLKGKAAPVRVWRLLDAHLELGEAGGAAAEAPLVGREFELLRLRAALDGAIASRNCRLVSVIGGPGLGKSRLAAEFGRSAGDSVVVVEGHCEPSGEGITFLPIAEVLRAAASIDEADSREEVIAKLTELVGDDADCERVVSRAAALLGAGDPVPAEETFWGVRRVLEGLARRQPLVVVFDDVHWGEPMFLDLLEHLVEWVRDAPVLLVALARPELREIREVLAAAGRRPVDVIELEPLDPGESQELVSGLLGAVDLPGALLARILETTEGNPLFLGELLRMLVDEGSLVQEQDVWVAAGGAEAVHVPPTIQALLTARIERLRADERSVVERAAVIGKQFYRGAVAELVAPPVRSGLDGHLETLRRKDIVEPEGTYWIDEPVYRFHHVLIRDAAYHLLLKEARAELHEKFADWLALKAGELVGEHEEVIAYHLEQAHAYRALLGPLDERGRALGARAAVLLASAGRRALMREDLAAAGNLLHRSLERGADDDAEVLWDLAETLLSAGDTARVTEVVDRLASVAPERAAVLAGQLAVVTGAGSLELTLASVTAATAALAEAGDGVGEAKGHHVTAQVQVRLGQVAAVEAALDRALLAARKAEDARRITAVLAAAPRAALWGPSPVVRASGRCLDVVRILRMTPGNRHVEAVALRCQAVLEAMRGRSDAARDILAAGRVTLEELGLTVELHELAVHAGIVELLSGEPAAAENLLRSARDGFESLGMAASVGQASALLARALVEQGRDEEAIAETGAAERHTGGDLKTTITWSGVRAEALARREAFDKALALARQAVELAEPTDALADKADANMALARVLAAAGRSDEASAAAEGARELYAAKDHAVGVARTSELALGEQPTVAALSSKAASDAGVPEDPVLAILAAQYAELGGRPPAPVLGELPTERVWSEFKRWFDAHDIDRLCALYDPGWILTDHRRLGMDVARGVDAARALWASVFEGSPDVRVDIDEVVAADGRVIIVRGTYRGTANIADGKFEVPFAVVTVVEGGRLSSTDIFEPDDRQAMITRYVELGGRPPEGLLGDRPPERLLAETVRLWSLRDVDKIVELYAEDFVIVDHRQLGWEEVRGVEAGRAVVESGLGVSPDLRLEVHEVLACDNRLIAARVVWRGTSADGGGEFDNGFGYVIVVDDGLIQALHQFEPDDRVGMMACYTELSGEAMVPGQRPPERWAAEFTELWRAGDWERLLDLYAADGQMRDRRSLPLWEPVKRRDDWRTWFAGVDAMQTERRDFVVDEQIACDDRVLAVRVRWMFTIAGADAEIAGGMVGLFENGLAVSLDVYDAEDRQAMTARYAELGGGFGPLGDRPPERWMREFFVRYAARNTEAMAALVDEHVTLDDHRNLAWDPIRGVEQLAGLWQSGWAASSDLRLEVDGVLGCDDRVIALRGSWAFTALADSGGGNAAIPFGLVAVIDEGRAVSWDLYEFDDTEAILARYAELSAATTRLGDTPVERAAASYLDLVKERDVEGIPELLAADVRVGDHRPLGGPQGQGREAAMGLLESALAITAELRFELEEVLEHSESVLVCRGTWLGTSSAGDGEVALPMAIVVSTTQGLLSSLDLYDHDDLDPALARYVELLPAHEKFDYLYNARRLDELLGLYTDDYVMIDRRALAWEEIRGGEALVETCRSFLENAPDLRSLCVPLEPYDGKFVLLRNTFTGQGYSAGGVPTGPVELVFIEVGEIRENRFASTELFDPADEALARARYQELRAAPAATA